jgi:hypothetical protein
MKGTMKNAVRSDGFILAPSDDASPSKLLTRFIAGVHWTALQTTIRGGLLSGWSSGPKSSHGLGNCSRRPWVLDPIPQPDAVAGHLLDPAKGHP